MKGTSNVVTMDSNVLCLIGGFLIGWAGRALIELVIRLNRRI